MSKTVTLHPGLHTVQLAAAMLYAHFSDLKYVQPRGSLWVQYGGKVRRWMIYSRAISAAVRVLWLRCPSNNVI